VKYDSDMIFVRKSF